MRYFLFVGVMVVACTEDRPAEHNFNGADVTTAPPRVWIDADGGLPTVESSATSLEVTVSGNKTATHYQYALFDDKAVTCENATYGDFKHLSAKLTEISLGNDSSKIICLRGKDADDNVQTDPKRYSWEKIAGPAVEAAKPQAELATEPLTDANEINSKVRVNDVTTGYQYALVFEEDYTCDGSNVSYSTVAEIDARLQVNLGNDGHKTLCLRGVDEDGGVQAEATRYSWEKTQSASDNDGDPPAASGPRIGLSGVAIVFKSGDGRAFGIVVKNVGGGTLKWKASSDHAAPWLQARAESNGSYAAVAKSAELAGGELAAGGRAVVHFRLTKGSGTDYGEPHKREQEIMFVDKDSGYAIKVKISLDIPKLDTQTARVVLNRRSSPVKAYTKNLNKSPGRIDMFIEVVPVFASKLSRAEKKAKHAKLTSMVTYVRGFETEDQQNIGERYVKFTVKPEGITGCETYRQAFLVYSNGDSKGASDCTITRWANYVGGTGGAKWHTTRCKRIDVTLHAWQHADLNDDGKVSILDLTFAAVQMGSAASPGTDIYRRADIDGNGTVEAADLEEISACFGYPES